MLFSNYYLLTTNFIFVKLIYTENNIEFPKTEFENETKLHTGKRLIFIDTWLLNYFPGSMSFLSVLITIPF